MADPNDIYKDLTPSGVPAPVLDEFGNPAGTPGFDPNSTAREAAAAAEQASKNARLSEAAGRSGVLVVPDSRADEWNATFRPGGENYSLTPSQWNDTHGQGTGDLRGFSDLRHKAREYHNNTSEAVSATLAAHKEISSADFVSKLATFDPTDPDYPTHFANLVATHPGAGGSLVDKVISHQQEKRDTFTKAMEHGGASEFGSAKDPTPEYHTYVTTFQKTKDPAQARTAAVQTAKNMDEIIALKGKGLLRDEDIPAWDDRWKTNPSLRPKVYNSDASINFREVKNLAAKREGAGEGLADQRKQVNEDRQLIATLGAQVDNIRETDPRHAGLVAQYQDALNRLTEHSQNLKAGTTSAPTPSPVSSLLPPPRKPK